MSRKIIILTCSLTLLCGCAAKGEKRSAPKSRVAVIERSANTGAGAASPESRKAAAPSVATLRPSARPNKPIIILPSEIMHTSITKYDPFGDYDMIEIDLGELAEDFCYPHKGNPTSRYGMRNGSMHTGLDIQASLNDTIRSILPGVVRMSKPYADYGNIVVVRHYNGLESIYAHNSKNLAEVNDIVTAGSPIALAGRTGRATGVHLHFELRVMGEHFDPELILDAHNHRLFAKEKLFLSRPGGRLLAETAAPTPKVYAQARPTQIIQPASEVKKAGKEKKNSSRKTYTISRGDTLYSIARKHNTSVDGLCRLNGISSSSTIYPGQRLRVR